MSTSLKAFPSLCPTWVLCSLPFVTFLFSFPPLYHPAVVSVCSPSCRPSSLSFPFACWFLLKSLSRVYPHLLNSGSFHRPDPPGLQAGRRIAQGNPGSPAKYGNPWEHNSGDVRASKRPVPELPLSPGWSSLTAHGVKGASRPLLKTVAQLENPLAAVGVPGSIHYPPPAPTWPSPPPDAPLDHLPPQPEEQPSPPREQPAQTPPRARRARPLGASRVLIGCPAKGAPPLGSRIPVPPPGLFPRCDARRSGNAAPRRSGSEGLRRWNAERDEVRGLRGRLGKERAPRYRQAGAPDSWRSCPGMSELLTGEGACRTALSVEIWKLRPGEGRLAAQRPGGARVRSRIMGKGARGLFSFSFFPPSLRSWDLTGRRRRYLGNHFLTCS